MVGSPKFDALWAGLAPQIPQILGHAGPDAIEQLLKHVNGAMLTEINQQTSTAQKDLPRLQLK